MSRSHFGRCPNRLDHILAGIWLFVALVAISDVEVDLDWYVILALLGLLPLLRWWLHGLIAIDMRFAKTFGPPRTLRENAAWFVLPAMFALPFALRASEAPLRFRFLLSEPALRARAERVLGEEDVDGRAGLFRVRDSFARDGRAHLTTCRLFLFGRAGFAYAPEGSPGYSAGISYDHFSGDWWIFHYND